MPQDDAEEGAASPAEPAAAPPGYPSHWEADVALSDGSTVLLRPIRPDDGDRLLGFHARQSPQSIYYR
jgi:hypothetical protein